MALCVRRGAGGAGELEVSLLKITVNIVLVAIELHVR